MTNPDILGVSRALPSETEPNGTERLVAPVTQVFLSPSLSARAARTAPAREIKFLLTEEQARRVEDELRASLVPDPLAVSAQQEGQYVTTTVYCDTPEFDVFHRRGSYGRRKFRLRRYDHSHTVYLERKSKDGTKVSKWRTGIPLFEVDRLHDAGLDAVWGGDWFRRRLAARKLSPKLAVMYCRTAYVGAGEEGPLRLTFDRSIQALRTDRWHAAPFEGGTPILTERVVCEFKFRGPLPNAFKSVIASQRLSPQSASKYRLGAKAVGLISERKSTNVRLAAGE